jgi:hypothetical protein
MLRVRSIRVSRPSIDADRFSIRLHPFTSPGRRNAAPPSAGGDGGAGAGRRSRTPPGEPPSRTAPTRALGCNGFESTGVFEQDGHSELPVTQDALVVGDVRSAAPAGGIMTRRKGCGVRQAGRARGDAVQPRTRSGSEAHLHRSRPVMRSSAHCRAYRPEGHRTAVTLQLQLRFAQLKPPPDPRPPGPSAPRRGSRRTARQNSLTCAVDNSPEKEYHCQPG